MRLAEIASCTSLAQQGFGRVFASGETALGVDASHVHSLRRISGFSSETETSATSLTRLEDAAYSTRYRKVTWPPYAIALASLEIRSVLRDCVSVVSLRRLTAISKAESETMQGQQLTHTVEVALG